MSNTCEDWGSVVETIDKALHRKDMDERFD